MFLLKIHHIPVQARILDKEHQTELCGIYKNRAAFDLIMRLSS